ncbi:glycosyltransferase family 4 protein [Arenibacter sp. GZD96]|uniref:glycosyltransferase family 4 protein n=1 Tax=Aurantibrevibacter litoralis TaxID=3106030 RepID=UPI002AFE84D7|nr:glycosyltransferase family 4 protein [Arenibacter sp. GZD-96]MEA1786446.1 glycosyltransferase family 4 protein [Arenibacter sp. GZD-96]
MKIAILTSRYPSKNNPYNHMFVHMRAVEMHKQGADVTVLVPSKTTETYLFENIKIIKDTSKKLTLMLDDFDVLYLHLLNIYPLSSSNGWPLYSFIMDSKIPFAMYVHGSEVQKYGARMFEFRFRLSDFLKWFKKDFLVIPKIKRFVNLTKDRDNVKLIFPSIWMKKDLEANLSLTLTKYHIIPNGIDTMLFKYHELYKKKIKLLTLRPLSSKKYAVDIAIKVMKYLPEEFVLDIYGRGFYKLEYEKLISKEGLENRVFIKDSFIERNQMNSFFSNYGIFLCPTRMDAQGVTMCEAMSSGLLTVSNNNTAIPEFIKDGVNGLLGSSPSEIANKILSIVDTSSNYYKLTRNANNDMKKIDIKITVIEEVRLLNELCGNG